MLFVVITFDDNTEQPHLIGPFQTVEDIRRQRYEIFAGYFDHLPIGLEYIDEDETLSLDPWDKANVAGVRQITITEPIGA